MNWTERFDHRLGRSVMIRQTRFACARVQDLGGQTGPCPAHHAETRSTPSSGLLR